MIVLKEKQDIILKYLKEGKSQRQIHRETGIARDTIRKYIREYEARLVELGNTDIGDIRKVDLIDDLTTKPKYRSSPRIKRAITDEVIERLKFFLKENEQKRLKGMSKQQKKKIDIYEALIKEGFDVSYSSVANAINSIEKARKEAFIKQEYTPGDVVEFDFGTVKLYTEDNILREYQLAVFTSAYGNYRWARLLPKQNTACFLEAHALFFKHIGGSYGTVVYDNTKVAVKRFVGHTEKEATDALLKLSLYYKFRFRFCNAYSGNEKGHVERSVEVIRRKAFANRYTFNSLEEANEYLQTVLDELNNKPSATKGKTPKEMLDEEREHLMPDMPIYETATIEDYRVSKYSTIMIDSCYYSVPDTYVSKMVRCKIYSSKILVFYDEEKIAEHTKLSGFNKWKIDINHFSYTLYRKPKALVNSTAFNQLDEILKSFYNKYFQNNERDFIKLISLVGTYGLTAIDSAIGHISEVCPTNVSIDKIEFLCTRKEDEKVIYLEDYNNDIMKNSIDMLSQFNELLK